MNASMRSIWLSVAMVTLLAAALPARAADKPSAKDVAAARGECSKHRRKVEKLEASATSDPNLLDKERSDWERSCAHAEMLMQAAGMEKPSPPPVAPPPAPTLIIEEGTAPRSKPVIIDEPSAPPTTDAKSPSSLPEKPEPPPSSAPPTPPGPYEPAAPPP